MKKKDNMFVSAFKFVKNFGEEHKRELELAGQITCTILTGVLAFQAGRKVDRILDEQKAKMEEVESKQYATEEEYKKARRDVNVETAKRVAPHIAKPVIAATGGIFAAAKGYSDANKIIAGLSTGYSMLENELVDAKDKAKDIIGAKKTQEVKDEANLERMKAAYDGVSTDEIISTGTGNILFYEPYGGTFFRSSWEFVRGAINNINRDWNDGKYDDGSKYDNDCVPFNDVRSELHLPADTRFGQMFYFKKDARFSHGTNLELMTATCQVESKVHPGTMESATVIDFYNQLTLSELYVKEIRTNANTEVYC